MGFFDSLQNSPNTSSIFGARKREEDPDIMGMDSEFRRRDFNDYAKKKQFDDQMSQRQGGLRDIFNPVANPNGTPMGSNGKPMDLVFKDNNSDKKQTTAEEDVNKDIFNQTKSDQNQQKLDIASEAANNKSDTSSANSDLAAKKNQQIYETKQKDMQRKMDEANSKLDLAERTLQSKQGDSDANLKFHQAQMDATNARHALEMSQTQAKLDEAKRVHDETIKNNKNKTDMNSNTTTTTEIDDTGKKKTVKTQKGSKRIGVTHPDGTHGTIDSSESQNLPQGWVLD